jgi:hypothetical protein
MAQTEVGKTLATGRFLLLLYRLCLLGCALGATASLYQIGGLWGHLNAPLLNFVLIAVVLTAAVYFLVIFWAIEHTTFVGRLAWYLILAILAVDLLLGLIPPTARDELTHHLAIPRLYADQGRIFAIPFSLPSYYPMLVDMFYVPFVRWEWDWVAKWIHGLFGFLTGLLVYAYLSLRLNSMYGCLGLLFFASTPIVLRLSSQAYVDLGLLFFSTASLLAILQCKGSHPYRWLVLGGLAAGFALATKPNGLLVAFLAVLLLLLHLAENRMCRAAWGQLAVFCVCAFVAFSPWVLRNFVWTGNPLFPFFTDIFGGGDRVIGDPGMGVLEKRRLLYGESWWEIAALPLRIFFFGRDDQPQHFDGVLNPILILFLPWAFKGKWHEEKRLLFCFSLCYLLLGLLLADLRIRYLVPILPALVILLVYGIHNVYLRVASPKCLVAVVVGLLAVNGIYVVSYLLRVFPAAYVLGRESREAYLTRTLPEYPIFQYLNQNLPDSARVYLVFVGRRAYYCRRSYFYDGGELPWVLLQAIRGAEKPERIASGLKVHNLTHLLVREDLLEKFLLDNLAPKKVSLWRSFQERRLKAVYHHRGFSLYQIDG